MAVEDDAFYTQSNKDALDMFNTVRFYNDYTQSDNVPMPQRDEHMLRRISQESFKEKHPSKDLVIPSIGKRASQHQIYE